VSLLLGSVFTLRSLLSGISLVGFGDAYVQGYVKNDTGEMLVEHRKASDGQAAPDTTSLRRYGVVELLFPVRGQPHRIEWFLESGEPYYCAIFTDDDIRRLKGWITISGPRADC
jgi:hypothetical protein